MIKLLLPALCVAALTSCGFKVKLTSNDKSFEFQGNLIPITVTK